MSYNWHVITSTIERKHEVFNVDTDVYEGPLSLLLDLIQRAELDITKLSLAKVTDQYLTKIKNLQNISAGDISAFLIIAAKLIQIKSEALLPRPPIRAEGEEDPGEALAHQLVVYREIKKTTTWLKSRIDSGLRTYLHIAHPYKTKSKLDLSGTKLEDLIKLLREIYSAEAEIAALGTVISIPKITLRRKIQSIMQLLRDTKTLTFRSILNKKHSRIDTIVVFLALLELIKQDYAVTHQTSLFSDIEIIATEKIEQSDEFDLTLED
ncbi:MAG: segregation/condensation protein A [Chloroflexota bacterium]